MSLSGCDIESAATAAAMKRLYVLLEQRLTVVGSEGTLTTRMIRPSTLQPPAPTRAVPALINGLAGHRTESVVREVKQAGAKKIGLCDRAPSDLPDLAVFLVSCGIDSISATPDSFIALKHKVAAIDRPTQ
jgi:hypothetical protein